MPDSASTTRRLTFETAATHATLEVPQVSSGERAADVLARLTGTRYECASHIAIVEDGRFHGLVRIEDLLAAGPAEPLDDFVDHDAPVVAPGIDQEVAAWRAVRHRESALAVVDEAGAFAGLIPPHRLLQVLLSEHEEDLSHAGGFVTMSQARRTSEEPVARRFRHRVPWLLVGLAGAVLAADIVGRYEHSLQATVALAFFLPGIVYMADAVGTQTETVVVRGLSVGVPMRTMVTRELLAGLAIGAALLAVATPIVYLRWGGTDLALTVGLSLFAACSTATLAAMALPWILSHRHADPAFGSGPLATVIQDLLSILIYFGIAGWLMG